MATISNTPRPGYVYDSTDGVWYPIGTGAHTHADYITSSSAINPNIVDAKGDIIAATAADTVSRLAVGANDTVLTADSSTATGLKWATPAAGGMTLLSTTTLSGATTTISSIDQTYNNLQIVVSGVTINTNNRNLRVAPNSSFNSSYQFISNSAVAGSNSGSLVLTGDSYSSLRTDANNIWVINYINYTSSTRYKPFYFYGRWVASSTTIFNVMGAGTFDSNTAITSWAIDAQGTDTFAGGTVQIYGVK